MADNSRAHKTLPADVVEQLLAQRQAFETAVILLAWNDPVFASALRQDPVAAINIAFGIELPAGLDVQLHQEAPSTLHLVLPPAPSLPHDHEGLLDEDLERVAGGSLAVTGAVAASIGGGVAVTTIATVSGLVSVASAVGTTQLTS